MEQSRVLICGTDDLATASAIRLYRAGLQVALANFQNPVDLHHHRTFTRAIFNGNRLIKGIRACTFSYCLENELVHADSDLNGFLQYAWLNKEIPVLLVEELQRGAYLLFDFVIILNDEVYRSLEKSLPDSIHMISGVENVEATYHVFTSGPRLGQVKYPFEEEEPESGAEKSKNHVVRAPIEGVFVAEKNAGDKVFEKEVLAKIAEIPILSPVSGVVLGILNSGGIVTRHTPLVEIGKITPNFNVRELPLTAWAVAGGVLEAVLFDRQIS